MAICCDHGLSAQFANLISLGNKCTDSGIVLMNFLMSCFISPFQASHAYTEKELEFNIQFAHQLHIAILAYNWKKYGCFQFVSLRFFHFVAEHRASSSYILACVGKRGHGRTHRKESSSNRNRRYQTRNTLTVMLGQTIVCTTLQM